MLRRLFPTIARQKRIEYALLAAVALSVLILCVWLGWPYWVEVWRLESATR